tara:strand:+ start:2077 stop:3069 length:993 start_codon:yes stop_codon:yes gene_type:complete
MKLLTPVLLVLSLLATSAQAATLKIATLAPDGTSWMKLFREAAAEIKTETEGRVNVKYFPGGVQGSDKSVLRKMQIRQLQGGAVASGAFAQIASSTQLYSLPFTFRNLEEVRAIREEFDPYIIQDLAKNGYVVLGISEGGFAYLMSNKAIRTSSDVQDRKVWVPEGDMISQTTFENGGVSPIALPVSDVYTSLQTGLIDTVAVNPSTSIALQWHTKLDYATDYPLVFLIGMMVVDDSAFKKISTADQATVKRVMAATFAKMDAQNEIDEAGARQALAQNGIEFVELTEADKTAWQALAKGAVAALPDKNVYPVDLYKKLQQRLIELRQAK